VIKVKLIFDSGLAILALDGRNLMKLLNQKFSELKKVVPATEFDLLY